MVDACYICRRTQVDLDHLNEELRTRAYLSYFTNARSQIDDQRRKISFLQRLKDEESGDPHFRINAKQVFGDPKAYEKLMPWIDTLIEVSRSSERPLEDSWTVGNLVEELLTDQRRIASNLEQGMDQLRSGFAGGEKAPLSLESVTYTFPVDWPVDGPHLKWRAAQANDRPPLQRLPGEGKPVVEMKVFMCTVCRRLLGKT